VRDQAVFFERRNELSKILDRPGGDGRHGGMEIEE
jgi:hypothetical protein